MDTLHVLVIDDYENQYMFIKDILSTLPHTQFFVDWASTFEAGQIGISSGNYDVCLVDYDLGERTGIDLVEYAIGHGYQTPMIVLTGRGSREVDVEAMRAGAADYLDKSNLKLNSLERSIRYAVERAKTITALRESEARQRALMQTVPSGVFFIQNNAVRYVNHMFTRMTGLTADEINGRGFKNILRHIAPAHRSLLLNQLFRLDNLESVSSIEFQAKTANGQEIWLDMAISVTYLDGQPAILGTLNDITRRIHAEKSEHDQRVFAEALLEISVILNQTLEVDSVLEHILQNLDKVVPYHVANIMLIEDDYAYVVAQRGYNDVDHVQPLQHNHLRINETPILLEMLERRTAIIRNDLEHRENWLSDVSGNLALSYIGVPIVVGGRVLGFLNLDSFESRFFTSRHLNRLQIFADLAAVAIQNALTFEVAQEEAAQEERQRLARDLHDAVSQTLFSANMIAETLPRMMQRNPDDTVEGLHKLARLTKGALAEMRTLLLELRPATLDRTDIRTLLHQLANAFESRTQVQVLIQSDAMPALVPDVKIVFYRIAQEALNNISKHARASEVNISLSENSEHVELMVVDNGRGFDMSTTAPERMGLSIMRERAESIQAYLTVESEPNNGTRVALSWEKTA